MENAEHSADTIVIVEPDVLVRMAIGQYLRECGYRVIEATHGHDVLTVLESGAKVEVVFSEVQLPGEMDGFTLARKVRQTQPNVDVILASSIAVAAEKSKELCEEGPLGKPYQPEDVLTRIKLLRERRRSCKKTT